MKDNVLNIFKILSYGIMLVQSISFPCLADFYINLYMFRNFVI